MDKLIMFRKKRSIKRLFTIITVIVIPLLGIGATIFSSGDKNEAKVSGDVNGIVAGSIKADEIKYENNLEPTQMEENSARYNQILKNKIHSFFNNLSLDKEFLVRNNIYKDFSRKFSPESVYEFCTSNNSVFLEEIFNDGPINNDRKIVSNKYDVRIRYDYKGKEYIDIVNMKVRLDPNDTEEKEIHISNVKCFNEGQGPFCKMFGY